MEMIGRAEQTVTGHLINHLGDQIWISAETYHEVLDSLEIIGLLERTLNQPERPWPAPA